MSASGPRKIIAIVGYPSSGKDTAARYLATAHKFRIFSASDYLRDYFRSHRLGAPTRSRMHEVANALRQEKGGGTFVQWALTTEPVGDLVIVGLRALTEGEAIKVTGGKILAIEAPPKTRFHRSQMRNRPGDTENEADFQALEMNERSSLSANQHNVAALVELADARIDNSTTLENLHSKIDAALPKMFS